MLRALLLAVVGTLVLFLAYAGGLRLGLLVLLALALATLVVGLPWFGVRWLDGWDAWRRARGESRQAGRHHGFSGYTLQIDDDGRHVWIDSASLQRALGTREREDVLAARHAGCWRRTSQGRLLLRVDAVVQQLTDQPGRDSARRRRLRLYLEREVLYPARQRQQRVR